VAIALKQIGFNRLFAEQSFGQTAGRGDRAFAMTPHAVAVGHVLREINGSTKLLRFAEAHRPEFAFNACRRSGIAGAKINADPHAGSVAGLTGQKPGIHATVALKR